MSSNSAPPARGQYLNSIYRSAKSSRESYNILVANEDIHRLLYSPAFINTFHLLNAIKGVALPLKFSSHLEELNFISIWALLDFGSSYRVPLHVATGRGSGDNIRALMFSLYLSSATGGEGDLLSAQGLQSISAAKIAELLGINLHVEKPHTSIPGVVVGQLGGPLYEFVKLLVGVLQDTGERLVNSGYPSLGAFVVEALKEGTRIQTQQDGPDALTEVLLERLVTVFPAFQDLAVCDEQPVYIFKKALQLIYYINVRFGSLNPPPFPVPSIDHLPILSDNTLPSMLVYLGVIDVTSTSLLPLRNGFKSSESADRLALLLSGGGQVDPYPANLSSPPRDGPHLPAASSYVLRGAAIDACQLIVDYARTLKPGVVDNDGNSLDWIKEITPWEIGRWIIAIAKDRKDYRELGRFVSEETVYF